MSKLFSYDYDYEVLVRRNLTQCIYLFTIEETETGDSRQSCSVVNSLGSFSCCGLSSSLRMIILNPLPLCSSRTHKHNNYDKATYTVSSILCLFTCPRPQAFHEIPTRRGILVQKRVFLKFIPLFLVLTFQIVHQYPRSEST